MAAKNFSPLRMTAATEDGAIMQALQIVGAERDEVSVEVVSQDAKGVTVRVSPRREGEAASEAMQAPAQVVAEKTEASDESAASSSEEFSIEEDQASDDEAETDEAETIAIAESEQEIAEPVAREEAAAPRDIEPPKEVRPIDPALQELAVSTAQQFLDRMGMDARACAGEGGSTDEAQRMTLDIEGEDVGILIGKHGQTLQAFQYLLNITLNNREAGDANPLRITVDAGGYRSRRAGSLQQVARDAAARSLRDRRPIRMEPMPAHERRLIHMALQEDASISTSSEGREPMRCVVVAPAGYRAPEGGTGFNRGGGNRGRSSGGFGGSSSASGGRGSSGFNRGSR